MQMANEKTPGTVAVVICDGAITAVNVVDVPMYWYDGAWQPYAKNDKMTDQTAVWRSGS